MNIRFLIPGKCREKFIIDGQNEYLKRLSKYGKISLVSLEEESLPSSPSDAQIKKALSIEADRALKQIKERKYPDSITDYTGGILLVGISYDTDSKEHSCIIEKYEK